MTEEKRELYRVLLHAPVIGIAAFLLSVAGFSMIIGDASYLVALVLMILVPLKYLTYQEKMVEKRFEAFKRESGLSIDYAMRVFGNAVVIDRTNRKVFLGEFGGDKQGKVYGFDEIQRINKETHAPGGRASYVLCVETNDFDNPRLVMQMGEKHHDRDAAYAKLSLALGMK